jgi:Tfp pilus assembly protein PilN
MRLNLASQPFVNSRPLRRLILVLWGLCLLLVATDLFLYTRHFSGQQQRRGRLHELDELEGQESERLTELGTELVSFDIDWQNRQVQFFNQRIAERVFPWSRLFDRLAKTLPVPVRLTRLRPRVQSLSGRGSGAEEVVSLELRAEARDEAAMLRFVERLFANPAFRSPNLASETRRAQTNVIEFALTVSYLPGRGKPKPKPPSAPTAAAAAAPADAGAAAPADAGAEASGEEAKP